MPVDAYQITLDGAALPECVVALLTRLELRESDCEAAMVALRFSLARPAGARCSSGVHRLERGLEHGLEHLFQPLVRVAVALAAAEGPLEPLFTGQVTHVRRRSGQDCCLEVLAMEEAALQLARRGAPGALHAQAHLRWVDLRRLEARGEVDCARWQGLLRARHTVLLNGVGRTFNGTYYVRTVRTTLEAGLLTQDFVALRSA